MAAPLPDDAFERHLRDAIRLNRERAPRYAELSGGHSRSVSRQLIATEVLLLPLARWFDRRARPFHRAGVPVMAALFVSMDTTPPFADELANPPTGPAPRYPAATTGKKIWNAYLAGGHEAAGEVLRAELERLRNEPTAHHMVRHILESALRVCAVAPDLARQALGTGLPDPDRLHARLLRMHAWGLGGAARLDRRAWPLQCRGLPILAQDLPPIPPRP